MTDFQQPFYKSSNSQIEKIYSQGVLEVQSGNHEIADNFFRQAAHAGHVSANYNLALLHGSGTLNKLNIDFAIKCVKEAAAAGHPNVIQVSEWLTKAENATLGTTGLAMLAQRMPPQSYPSHVIMILACRFYLVLCQHFDVADEVVKVELSAAHNSEHDYIQRFIKRTGLKKEFYEDGEQFLKEGSPTDQITDGLNDLFMALLDAGNPMEMCLYVRCSIIGYIIENSSFGNNNGILLGYLNFLEEQQKKSYESAIFNKNNPEEMLSKNSQPDLEKSLSIIAGVVVALVVLIALVVFSIISLS